MENVYLSPARPGMSEITEKRSRFIGNIAHVESEQEALDFVKSIKKEYYDAKHSAYAYISGTVRRYSDDGEPAKTAGLPILDMLDAQGLTDCVCVVTRYFGGVLLGTGGLVRAYTSAALGALEGGEIIRYDVYTEAELSVSYSDYGKIASVLEAHGFRTENTLYDVRITLSGRIVSTNYENLEADLIEATAGRIEMKKLGEAFGY